MDSLEFKQSVRSDLMTPAVTALRDTYLAEKMEDAILEDRARASGEVTEREPLVRPYRPLSDAIEARRLDDRERAQEIRSAK